MSLADVPGWFWGALFSAGMTWGLVRAELRYLRRDVDHAHRRIDELPCAIRRRATDQRCQPEG